MTSDKPRSAGTDLTTGTLPEPTPTVQLRRSSWFSGGVLQVLRAVLRGLLALVLGLGGLVVVLSAITTLTDPSVRASNADVPIAWVALVLGAALMAGCARLCHEARSSSSAHGDADTD